MAFRVPERPVSNTPNVTGDIEISAFDHVATILNVPGGAIPVASLPNIDSGSFLANITGGTAAPTDHSLSTFAGTGLTYTNLTGVLTWDGLNFRKNSAGSVFTRRRINLIEGSNVTITVADDAGDDEVDVTIAATGSGGSIDVRKNSTGSVFTRPRINLIEGTNVTLTVADDAGDDEVDITIAATGGGGNAVPDRFDLTHSPIALYHGEGDVLDYSGNSLDLTLGTIQYRQVLPNVLGLMSGASSPPRRSSTDASLSITGDITVQAIVEVYSNPSTSEYIVSFTASGETEATNTLYHFGWSGTGTLRWLSESGSGTDAQFLSTGTLEILPGLGKIYYVAAVRESNVVTFYLNGLPYGSSSGTLSVPTGGSSSVLQVNGGSSFATLGVKIVASALTAAQIKAEYNRTMGVAFGTLP